MNFLLIASLSASALLFVFSLLVVGAGTWMENHHPKTKH